MSISQTFSSIRKFLRRKPSSDDESSDRARAAWDRQYPTRMLELNRGDMPPFTPGRHLGNGGFGQVHESTIDGTFVALKRISVRGKPQARHLAELRLLQKMSSDRHKHVVEAIGFYILPGRPNSEIGLLLWPVAQWDLARVLTYMEILRHKLFSNNLDFWDSISLVGDTELEVDEMEVEAMEELIMLGGSWQNPAERLSCVRSVRGKASKRLIWDIWFEGRLRVHRSMGCIANAIDYLHNKQMIRHRDLKPSQILLSRKGLWVTDFGCSLDVSDLSNSATSNGAKITAKYHAPEREAGYACGRAEDVFGLGCIFTETLLAMAMKPGCAEDVLNPQKQSLWSFQSHLDLKKDWVAEFPPQFDSLSCLINDMLERDPNKRPSMSEVIRRLSSTDRDRGKYFWFCCTNP